MKRNATAATIAVDFQSVKQRALTGVEAAAKLGSLGVVREEKAAEPDEG
jgi:hypothetical protein